MTGWSMDSTYLGLSVYRSTSRSMARFGLLALNKGNGITEQIVPETLF
jgi:CubicO group peptidase (beta-lactamase class C family)